MFVAIMLASVQGALRGKVTTSACTLPAASAAIKATKRFRNMKFPLVKKTRRRLAPIAVPDSVPHLIPSPLIPLHPCSAVPATPAQTQAGGGKAIRFMRVAPDSAPDGGGQRGAPPGMDRKTAKNRLIEHPLGAAARAASEVQLMPPSTPMIWPDT
jgi:hypothetical protein